MNLGLPDAQSLAVFIPELTAQSSLGYSCQLVMAKCLDGRVTGNVHECTKKERSFLTKSQHKKKVMASLLSLFHKYLKIDCVLYRLLSRSLTLKVLFPGSLSSMWGEKNRQKSMINQRKVNTRKRPLTKTRERGTGRGRESCL